MITGAIIDLRNVDMPPAFWIMFPVREAIGGAINGAVFAGLLILMGRRQTFATLSVMRVATCGLVAGMMFPAIGYIMLPLAARVHIPGVAIMFGLGVGAVAGAICGATSLLVARRAPQLPTTPTPTHIGAGAA